MILYIILLTLMLVYKVNKLLQYIHYNILKNIAIYSLQYFKKYCNTLQGFVIHRNIITIYEMSLSIIRLINLNYYWMIKKSR
jgi:hypothetical protein